ncbi:unnamed protein product [Rhodiola kirilowii]
MQQQEQIDHRYVEALEMERMKMLMFERELPLSIELVSRAIESCRIQLLPSTHRIESSEETTSYVQRPVLEFIPMKKSTDESSSGSEDDLPRDKDDESEKKSDWLSSVHLWNTTPDLPTQSEAELPGKELCKEKSVERITESSSTESKESQKGGEDKEKEDKAETSASRRKQRRCWSQDLHRRFLHSLQQLGGAHVATPKQIRELMKVDGLTNDEVKSHLQKYRLHTRRPTPPPNQNHDSHDQAPPQFMIVGGVWATPSDYTTMTLTPTVAVNREAHSVVPMAAPPAQPHPWQEQQVNNQKPQIKSKNSEGHGDGPARCISSSMSSSTRTTASQVY